MKLVNIGRSSGILLHVTSLPGKFGIGDLGPESRNFVDFLVEAKQKLWCVLPLTRTGDAHSPYQCRSAFAGNPLLAEMAELAKSLQVVLPVSFFERAGHAHFNSLAMIDADGTREPIVGPFRR